MGLFDFFKPKQNPLEALLGKDPRARRIAWLSGCSMINTQAENLRAVGRKDEAKKVVQEYFEKVYLEFKMEPENPRHLSLFADVALKLGAPDVGKRTLESVITENNRPHLDLTLVYFDLGRIWHDLGDKDRELSYYEKSVEAEAPAGCKFPATRKQKAIAHYFAHVCLTSMQFTWEFYMKQRGAGEDDIARAREKHSTDAQRADSHIKKARELAPEINWDDGPQVTKLIQSEK